MGFTGHLAVPFLDEAIGGYDVVFVREEGCIVLQGDQRELEDAAAAILARLA